MLAKTRFLFINMLFIAAAGVFGQVASRTDGVDVFYYSSLHNAVFATPSGTSIDNPDEIILLADVVLDEPLTVDDGIHIRLVPQGDRTIRRSANLIEFPVIWVNGDSASLTLGKPGMEHELIVDGGWLNSQPIEAHCPLVAVSGPDAKLIMYDKVAVQNNKNSSSPIGTTHYQNGAGVFIRTEGDIPTRQAEFIMKGGNIRGNINDVQTPLGCGGGVFIAGFGLFTMEGGIIMNNTARITGGGFHTGSRGSFKKTGGIIYGANAPAGYRNTALNGGTGMLKTYGHAVCVAIVKPSSQFRNDTVGENDNLSYTGMPTYVGYHIFGEGDKWDNPDKALRRMLLAIILLILAVAACVFVILRKRAYKKLMKIAQEAKSSAPKMVFENANLTDREKEIGPLLLSELKLKQIASVMKIAYTTADFHAKNVYKKMEVEGRTELLIMSREQ